MVRYLALAAFASALHLSPVSAIAPQIESRTPAEKLRSGLSESGPLVVAHRGCWGEAPEVSVAAIQACDGTGVDGVEIDIRKTRDGVLVLIHDETVDRTTSGSGAVAEMDFSEIRALRLRAGAGGADAPITDQVVPTLEEGLLAARGRYFVHLDYKVVSLDELADAVRRVGMAGQVTAWLRGAPDRIEPVAGLVTETIGLVPVVVDCRKGAATQCASASPGQLDDYARFRPPGYFLTYRVSLAFVRQVARAERRRHNWIATETLGRVDQLPPTERDAYWKLLLDSGVKAILTDHPLSLVKLRDRL